MDRKPYTVVADVPPAPLPAWLAALLRPAPPPSRPVAPSRGGEYCPKAMAGLLRTVLEAAPGERNSRLNWVSYRAFSRRRDHQVAAALLRAAREAGLPEGEARRTISSAWRAAAGGRAP